MEQQTQPTQQEIRLHQETLRTRYNRIAGIILVPFIALGIYALFAHNSAAELAHENVALKTTFDSVAIEARHFRNKDSVDVVQNIALRAQNEGAIKELSAATFNLQDQVERNIKAINYYSKIAQKTTLPQVIIHYDSTTKIALVASGRSDSIAVPQNFAYSDSLYKIRGAVTKVGLRIDSTEIFNTVYLRSGVRKYGFLNLKREDFVQAINTNKAVTINGLSEIHLPRKQSQWSKWIKPTIAFGLGFAGAVYLMK